MTRSNINVSMTVSDKGNYVAHMSLNPGKNFARFTCEGLPDLAGNHLYVKCPTRTISVCALRINNGTLERNRSWRGIIRFDSLSLQATDDSVILMEDGQTGESIVIYAGDPIYFLPRKMIELRFVVCKLNEVEEARKYLTYEEVPGLATSPIRGNYGPHNSRLPSVVEHNYAIACSNKYNALLNAWRTGQPLDDWETSMARYGPWMYAGEPTAYTHGGNGISPNHGYEQCREGTLMHRFLHSRWMDRLAVAIFDQDGQQLTVDDFVTPLHFKNITGVGPRQYENELSPFLTGDFNNCQYVYHNPGPTILSQELWSYDTVDAAHIIRAILHGIAVEEFTGDEMCREDLLAIFENIRFFDFSDRSDEFIFPCGYNFPSIKYYAYLAANDTFVLDRAFGWAMYLGAQIRRMGFDRRGWSQKMLRLARLSARSDGIISRNYNDYTPEGTQAMQTFHGMIVAIGYHALSVQLNESPAQLLVKFAQTVLDNPNLPPIADEYNPTLSAGPAHWIWTDTLNGPLVVSSEYTTGDGDAAHVSQVLALTYRATLNIRWLQVSLRHWILAESLQQKLEMLKVMSDKSWGGELQSCLENLAAFR